MGESEHSEPQTNVVNTGGGTYIKGNTNIGGDMAGRDIINNYYGAQPSIQDSSTNLEELFSKAIRLHLHGKLLEALEVYIQIKASNPHYPRLGVEMAAIEAELERGRRFNYINDRGEIVKEVLIDRKFFSGLSSGKSVFLIGHGGVGKSALLSSGLSISSAIRIKSLFGKSEKNILDRYTAQPLQTRQSKLVFYIAEVNTSTELREHPNKESQVSAIIPNGVVVRVKVEQDESLLQMKHEKEQWTAVRYSSHDGWVITTCLGRNLKVSINKYYG